MSQARLRFSPAPTGYLHIGSVRTALYNWLYARHIAGTFILRIEDTDVARSTQESVDQIQHVMAWLGLGWASMLTALQLSPGGSYLVATDWMGLTFAAGSLALIVWGALRTPRVERSDLKGDR